MASPLGGGNAHAAIVPTGALCGVVGTTDPHVEHTNIGVLFGGPLVLRDDSQPARFQVGRNMTCTMQVNASTHAGADNATASSVLGSVPPLPVTGSFNSVVLVAAQVVSFNGVSDSTHYLCTSVRLDQDTTLYWAASGGWSSSNNVPCEFVITADVTNDVTVYAHLPSVSA